MVKKIIKPSQGISVTLRQTAFEQSDFNLTDFYYKYISVFYQFTLMIFPHV